MSSRLTCGGGRSRSAGEGEGRWGRGSGTLLGLSDNGSIVSADGNQAGAQPVGRVVDDVPVGIGSALVGARTGWRRTGTGLIQSPQPPALKPTGPCLPVGLYVHWRPPEVQSLGGGERRAEGQQGPGLIVPAWPRPVPAPCPPRPRPRSATGSPALAVLRRGDPGAGIVVVSVLVVAAATLGHALHLVLVEERLAGRALWVAAWGGHRAGRRLPSQARWWGCPGRHPSLSPCPEGGHGEAGARAECAGATRRGLPRTACPHLPGLAGPSGNARWGSGRSSGRGPRRAGSAIRTPLVGCSSRRTGLSEGERGCGRPPGPVTSLLPYPRGLRARPPNSSFISQPCTQNSRPPRAIPFGGDLSVWFVRTRT